MVERITVNVETWPWYDYDMNMERKPTGAGI
jgi:hypothetical protein